MALLNKFQFERNVAALNGIKKTMPIQLANIARSHFVASFTNQGFTDSTLEKWKEVQRRIEGTPEYDYPLSKGLSRRTDKILIRTGKLRREVNNSIRSANWNEIRLGISDATPYAQYLNEGTDKMVKREFMGNSAILNKKIHEKIRGSILGALKLNK